MSSQQPLESDGATDDNGTVVDVERRVIQRGRRTVLGAVVSVAAVAGIVGATVYLGGTNAPTRPARITVAGNVDASTESGTTALGLHVGFMPSSPFPLVAGFGKVCAPSVGHPQVACFAGGDGTNTPDVSGAPEASSLYMTESDGAAFTQAVAAPAPSRPGVSSQKLTLGGRPAIVAYDSNFKNVNVVVQLTPTITLEVIANGISVADMEHFASSLS